MTDLASSETSLKNLVARPGKFSIVYPETTNGDLLAVLMDGFAECQLDQLFPDNAMDVNGVIAPDLTAGQVALVIITAGIRFIRAELLNRPSTRKYQAGPLDFEETIATNVMRDIMKALEQKRRDIIEVQLRGTATNAFMMADSYLANAWGNPLSLCLDVVLSPPC